MLMTLIRSLVSRLVKDQTMTNIIMFLLGQIVDQGSILIQPTIELIKEAASLPLTTNERFEFVASKLKEQYPGMASSFINQTIESCYTAWKAGKI
jgi:hypothetical protein